MKCTGIVRRIDDLGRIVIPKEIRNTLEIRECEPLEVFVDTEEQMVCFKKYRNEKSLSKRCKEIVEKNREDIMTINLIGYTTTIVTADGRLGQAVWNGNEEFDINIGIAYALVDAGYIYKEEIEED